MALFPPFVELQGRPCVVLGGGAVAERKVESLLAAGAVVTVVSPALSPALATLASDQAQPAARLEMELTVNHERKRVGVAVKPLPFFDPPRKRA